jgi:periplasmic copper chaperone A
MRLKALMIIAAAFAWCGGICTPISPAAAHDGEPGYRKGQIHAIAAWSRINPVPGRPAAVFFTLHNESAIDDVLVKVSSPIAKRAAIHSSQTLRDGMVKMMATPKVAVAGQDMALFEPGGLHVMLFDLVRIPKVGERFPLTLTFAKGKPQTIEVEAGALLNKIRKPATEHMHH